jgi:1-acyl-sn-glycerol-3-phosphate acyltransferase
MDNRLAEFVVSVFRGTRLVLHLFYSILLAIIYPYLNPEWQRRILKLWSKQLLVILNIGIQIEGQQFARGEGSCMLVANHVSWMDIFVLNAIHPSQFIAKSEVCDWPVIGWLSRRIGTIFVERAIRQSAPLTIQRVKHLLRQGTCIGLFPEGTTTDGKQVGHFHSAFFQPAIDECTRICPIALRYQNKEGAPSTSATFIGDDTLVQSIWKILRSPQINALVVFTPTLRTDNENRRMLARTAQEAVALGLTTLNSMQRPVTRPPVNDISQSLISSRSTYALLIDPSLNLIRK